MKNIVKEYTNGEVVIVWKPDLCTHASFCWRELPEVFRPTERPWVNPIGATTGKIIAQIKRCPSGALSYYMGNNKKHDLEVKNNLPDGIEVQIHKNGPLFISGNITVVREGKAKENHLEGATFCRCGKSKNQPYCDGSHAQYPFED